MAVIDLTELLYALVEDPTQTIWKSMDGEVTLDDIFHNSGYNKLYSWKVSDDSKRFKGAFAYNPWGLIETPPPRPEEQDYPVYEIGHDSRSTDPFTYTSQAIDMMNKEGIPEELILVLAESDSSRDQSRIAEETLIKKIFSLISEQVKSKLIIYDRDMLWKQQYQS